MKLIISGATGFVGKEVVLQALRKPQFTSVVALSRKPVRVEAEAEGAAKLKNLTIEDYAIYPDNVKKELAGAAACIWTVAITPTGSKDLDFDYVKRVCQEFTLIGLKAIHEAGTNSPFRFIYMSGAAAERDQTVTPKLLPEYALMLPEYTLMRGETENQVLAYAAAHAGEIEPCVVRPGLITSVDKRGNPEIAKLYGSVDVSEISAAMLKQVIDGIDKDTLTNEELVKAGQEALKHN